MNMSRIPKSNEIFTFQVFLKHCEDGTLTDDIGFGKLTTKTLMSDLTVAPSDALSKFYRRPSWATQVVWFKFTKPREPFDPDDPSNPINYY